MLRFINNIDKSRPKSFGTLKQEELIAADTTILNQTQLECFVDEITVLQKNLKKDSKMWEQIPKASVIYQLCPALDDKGILRQNSRIRAAEHLPYQTRYPIILPAKHHVTRLIFDKYHRMYRHANFETTVNEIRQLYAIPQLRSIARKVYNACQICKIRKSLPVAPPMAPLPMSRLSIYTRPFSYVGLDYFGPILVKQGRAQVKRWIALFTCLTIRAVHLEVAYNLSTASCISCVRRFISRRGPPLEITSDNGTNFQGANRILKTQIVEGLSTTFTTNHTRWNFIPPGAPHMGGAWERLVRSVKAAMADGYTEGKLNDEGLQTLISEAEYLVNARPLTYLPLDSEESEALTPNHFLIGSSNGVKQSAVDLNEQRSNLRESLEIVQQQLDRFWVRFVKEYLPVIRRQSKWFEDSRTVRVGDLVLIVDGTKRSGWIRGRVVTVHEAADGHVRQAIVKTCSGELRRPVTKLAVLDVGSSSAVPVDTEMHSGEDVGT